MHRFEHVLRECGFINAPAKRRGPAQEIESSGQLLDFVRARVTEKPPRCVKIVRDIEAALPSSQVCVPEKLVDSLTGKLKNIQFTVKGARTLLAPLHLEKALVRKRWRNPQGRTPRGAMIMLSPSARESLSVWRRILSRECPPSTQLFVFADGSMEFWDTDTCMSPWALPVPRGDVRVLCVSCVS